MAITLREALEKAIMVLEVENFDEAAQVIQANLDELTVDRVTSVGVAELIWEKDSEPYPEGSLFAFSSVGTYRIAPEDGGWVFSFKSAWRTTRYPDLEAVKAAARKHYVNRVRQALHISYAD